jgi:hypothetical protein
MTDSPIIAFYRGAGPDHRGRFLHEIREFGVDELESTHDFIQWLFPLPERSGANPHAPLLSASDIDAFGDSTGSNSPAPMRRRASTARATMRSAAPHGWTGRTTSFASAASCAASACSAAVRSRWPSCSAWRASIARTQTPSARARWDSGERPAALAANRPALPDLRRHGALADRWHNGRLPGFHDDVPSFCGQKKLDECRCIGHVPGGARNERGVADRLPQVDAVGKSHDVDLAARVPAHLPGRRAARQAPGK